MRDDNALVQVGETIFPKVLKNNNIETQQVDNCFVFYRKTLSLVKERRSFNFAILKSILSFSHFAHYWYYWPFLGPECFFSKAGVLFNWLYLILFKCGFLSNRYWLTRRMRNVMIDEVYDKEKWNCNVCCDKISKIFSKAPNVVY